MTGQGALHDEPESFLQIPFEAFAETFALPVKVDHGLFDFRFRGPQETCAHYFLRDRSRSNSSAAGTESMFPALYSA